MKLRKKLTFNFNINFCIVNFNQYEMKYEYVRLGKMWYWQRVEKNEGQVTGWTDM